MERRVGWIAICLLLGCVEENPEKGLRPTWTEEKRGLVATGCRLTHWCSRGTPAPYRHPDTHTLSHTTHTLTHQTHYLTHSLPLLAGTQTHTLSHTTYTISHTPSRSLLAPKHTPHTPSHKPSPHTHTFTHSYKTCNRYTLIHRKQTSRINPHTPDTISDFLDNTACSC